VAIGDNLCQADREPRRANHIKYQIFRQDLKELPHVRTVNFRHQPTTGRGGSNDQAGCRGKRLMPSFFMRARRVLGRSLRIFAAPFSLFEHGGSLRQDLDDVVPRHVLSSHGSAPAGAFRLFNVESGGERRR
jgi:hypothetical protein